MSKILGISAFYHDSSAALLIDGKIVAASQEERFTRIKHDSNYPVNSVNFVLNFNNLKLSDIDAIVFYEKPFLKFERILETYLSIAPKGFKQFSKSIPLWIKEKLFQKQILLNLLKEHDTNFNSSNKIFFSEHHLSHAASAFYPSPFEDAIILTADGVGEWETTTVSIGEKHNLSIKKKINFPHSIGLLYSAFTSYIGFKVNSGEYKLMGLAPYGKPKYKDLIENNLIDIKADGSFILNMKYFNFLSGLTMTNEKFHHLFGRQPRKGDEEQIEQFHMDIASSIQSVTEDIVLKICKSIKEEYKKDNLCLAGGVALNCVANGKILDSGLFKNLWIQPAAGDAGGSLGAALAYYHLEKNNERKILFPDSMNGSLLGPFYNDDNVEKSLNKCGANFKKLNENDLLKKIASDISQGKIVGWFQGRMEFGPRSLGNRAILADPRKEEMQKKLNLKIKFRESFRPFAPSITYESVNKWFNLNIESPYMLLVSEINNDNKIKENIEELKDKNFLENLYLKRSNIPAVTHVDYSARIQTVHKETNQKFYNLLKEFERTSNCPILVNTSFNVRGEPIVCSVEDAFNCFMATDLDILVCNNFILYKNEQNNKNLHDYKNKFELD